MSYYKFIIIPTKIYFQRHRLKLEKKKKAKNYFLYRVYKNNHINSFNINN